MKRLSSLRTRYQYNAALMFVGSLLAAFASFALTVDAFILAKTPAKTLGCDVNGNISCSSVARSWQSNLVYIWGVNVPNAVFGLLFMGIFIGFTAALMFGYRPGRIVTVLFSAGIVVCVVFALWLLGVSVLWLHVLCPWCLTLDAAIILQVIGYVRWMRTKDDEPKRHMFIGNLISVGIEVMPWLALLANIVTNRN